MSVLSIERHVPFGVKPTKKLLLWVWGLNPQQWVRYLIC